VEKRRENKIVVEVAAAVVNQRIAVVVVVKTVELWRWWLWCKP